MVDILTRIKNSQFRSEVLSVLQSAKINQKIQGANIIKEMPMNNMVDVYFAGICKLVQDVENHNQEIKNEDLLREIVIMALCKSRKGKKFDDYYNEIINDLEKNIKLTNKLFMED
jgi:hypothetical protein